MIRPAYWRHPDFQALWRGCQVNIRDDAPWLVLADWLEEFGAEPPLSRAIRWCAKHKFRPTRLYSTSEWMPESAPNNPWHVMYLTGKTWKKKAPGLGKTICEKTMASNARYCGCIHNDLWVVMCRVGRALIRMEAVGPDGRVEKNH